MREYHLVRLVELHLRAPQGGLALLCVYSVLPRNCYRNLWVFTARVVLALAIEFLADSVDELLKVLLIRVEEGSR